MSDGRLHLKSFAAGKTIRYFQAESTGDNKQTIYHTFNYDKNLNALTYKNDDSIKFHYLKKDAIGYSTQNIYDEKFLDYLTSALIKNNDEVYYDKLNIDCDSSLKLIQIGKKVYFLSNDGYKSLDDMNSYDIKTFSDNVDNSYEELKKYISNTYSDEYFDNANNLNNKAIPVYKLNEEALKDIHFIRLINTGYISEMLNNWPALRNYEDKILFNSEECILDKKNFDSILVDNMLDAIVKEDLNPYEIFEFIFSHIPQESFYRLLVPIANIKTILIKLNDYNMNIISNDTTQYLYSSDLSKNTNDISTNYFSLKNLKNPELYQDYDIRKNESFKSVKSPAFSLNNNVISKIFCEYEKDVVSKAVDIMNNHDLRKISKLILSGDSDTIEYLNLNQEGPLVNDISNIIKEYFPKFDEDNIEKYVEAVINGEAEEKREFTQAFKVYMRRNYNIDISVNKILMTPNAFVDEVMILLNAFKDKLPTLLASFSDSAAHIGNYIENEFYYFISKLTSNLRYTQNNVYNDMNILKTITDLQECNYNRERQIKNNHIQNKIAARLVDIRIF